MCESRRAERPQAVQFALLLAALLVGCASGDSPKPASSASSTVMATPGLDSATPTAAVSALSIASASAASVASSKSAPTAWSTTPERSPRPSVAEWSTAEVLADAQGCRISRLREWLQVRCSENTGIVQFHDSGKPAVDYFEGAVRQSVELRPTPGGLMTGATYPGGVHFWVGWPKRGAAPMFAIDPPGRGAPATLAPRPLPVIVLQDQPRPAELDWLLATPVNTLSAEAGKHCSLEVLDQWARFTCQTRDLGLPSWRELDSFGFKGQDYDVRLKGIADATELVFRVHRSVSGFGLLSFSGTSFHVIVKYEWPDQAPQPTVLGFQEIEQ